MQPRELMPWDDWPLFSLTSDPDVTRYLGFRTHRTVDEAAALLKTYKAGPGRWFGMWDGNRLCGVVGVEKQGHCAAMALYAARPVRGFGRIAGVAFVRWAFDSPEIKRVFAHCHVDNVPVQRVLERMGATREGRMRSFAVFPNISPEPADCYLYSIVRGDRMLHSNGEKTDGR
jgi:RimJ/RimL family protein N-acetyltransferase